MIKQFCDMCGLEIRGNIQRKYLTFNFIPHQNNGYTICTECCEIIKSSLEDMQKSKEEANNV